MKKWILPKLLLLSGFCFSQNLIVTELRPHPTFPFNEKVEIFFPGEPLPTVPYIKLAIIEVQAAPNTGEAIRLLRSEAARLGYDALFVLSDNRYTDHDIYAFSRASVATVAIKFRRNIQAEQVHSYHFLAPTAEGEFAKVGYVDFEDNGQVKEVKVKYIWWDILQLYSITELLNVPDGWQAERNGRGQLVRKSRPGISDYQFEYDSNDRLWRAEVERKNQFRCQVTFSHDREGRVIEQLVGATKFHGPLIFRYERAADGKVTSILVSQVDGRLPIFKVEMGYRDRWEQLR